MWSTGRMKRCAVVCNGRIQDYRWLREALEGYGTVLAADGGYDHCRRCGIVPAAVLGDMDSISEEPSVPVFRHPAEKDRSDMEIAVDHAIGLGFESIDVFGALGGRRDHELCNIMVCAEHPGSLRLIDGKCAVSAVGRGGRLEDAGRQGDIITLVSLDAEARCTVTGLLYPLRDEPLRRGSRGLSNVMKGDRFTVEVSSGTVLVFHLGDTGKTI